MTQLPRDHHGLPIDALRDTFLVALDRGPVVVSSPTGSGKSTQIPRWCPGRVLVVEPRRVACRSLAQRVAELEGCELGTDVGYQVRDEQRMTEGTRILFVTPGIALRRVADWKSFDTMILDEFHERGLEVDLLLALSMRRFDGHRVVMSATLDGQRVADHLGGRHLHAEGRLFDVDVRHVPGSALLPDTSGLQERLLEALHQSRELEGDVLVFLPGKGEIQSCRRVLQRFEDLDVLDLHGGLSLTEQNRLFQPSRHRKVVLATNVAETSLTLPGIGVVIDSGLVRQTRYARGRGFLTLVPVAMDSAEQRRGRAGRTSHGVCLRLWSAAAKLEARTAPEVHRESLVPLVLAAAACGELAENLPFFDPPKQHALEAARDELRLLGALDENGRLQPGGQQLFALPLDVVSGRLLVEAQRRDTGDSILLDDMIDLVAALSSNRSLITRLLPEDDAEDEVTSACDGVALIRAMRRPKQYSGHLHPHALAEAQRTRQRLRKLFGCRGQGSRDVRIDRRRLAGAVLAADPRSAHLARRRGRRVAWANGGTEVELGRDSAVGRLEAPEAVVVLATRAVGLGGRETRVLMTQAMPVPVQWIAEAGLGRDRLGSARVEGGVLWATLERVFARRVLSRDEVIPEGAMARQALVQLILEGQLWPELAAELQATIDGLLLAKQLSRQGLIYDLETGGELGDITEAGAWLLHCLELLEFDHGQDLPLLGPSDVRLSPLPEAVQQEIDKHYPRRLVLPGVTYELEYRLAHREVVLKQLGGRRMEVPSPTYLPKLPGLRVRLEHKGNTRWLRRPG